MDGILGVAAIAATVLGLVSVVRDRLKLRQNLARREDDEALLEGFRLNFEESTVAIGEQSLEIRRIVDRFFTHLPSLSPRTLVSSTTGRYVVEATRKAVGDHVIVKFISARNDRSELIGRHALFNEAFSLSLLDGRGGPRLFQIVDGGKSGPILVRESIPGASLDRALIALAEQGTPPTFRDVQVFLSHLALTVGRVHDQGVIHGDIKPANIVGQWKHLNKGEVNLSACSGVQLIDFESSSLLDFDAIDGGQVRGTPRYMAPERYAFVRGSRASDVYSCSAIAAFLLTGRPVRPGSTAAQRIPSPSLRAAVRRGLSVNLADRHGSIAEWSEDISAGFSAMESEIHLPVQWPLDPEVVRRELSKEAVTVALRPFNRILESVDQSTMDGIMRSSYAGLTPRVQKALNRWWYDGIEFEHVAKELNTEPEVLMAEIAEFIEALEESLQGAAAREFA